MRMMRMIRTLLRSACVLAVLTPGLSLAAEGTPAEALQTLPDFKVERLLSADKAKNGSWINLAKDNKGRLLLGGQNGKPVTRVTIKDGKVEKEEALRLPVSETMGILWAFDSLYVNGSRAGKFGLFRLRDKDGDDQFEAWEMLREWKGGAGEHGAHGIVLGPAQHLRHRVQRRRRGLRVRQRHGMGLGDAVVPADPRVPRRERRRHGFSRGNREVAAVLLRQPSGVGRHRHRQPDRGRVRLR